MTHWRTIITTDHIGAYSLQTLNVTELTVKILSIKAEDIAGEDGKKKKCPVAQLEGHKPFIINATNAKTITKIYNTPDMDIWAGKLITLYIAKIRAFGETVECLRIRETIPKPPEKNKTDFLPNNPKWAITKEKISTGEYTIEELQEKFIVSPENINLLLSK